MTACDPEARRILTTGQAQLTAQGWEIYRDGWMAALPEEAEALELTLLALPEVARAHRALDEREDDMKGALP